MPHARRRHACPLDWHGTCGSPRRASMPRRRSIVSNIEQSIDVNVPVSAAYNQWTQFEEFPRFMEGVREVKQLDDKRLLWRADIGGKEKQWTAKITDQIPDHRIAWESESGEYTSGVVNF